MFPFFDKYLEKVLFVYPLIDKNIQVNKTLE